MFISVCLFCLRVLAQNSRLETVIQRGHSAAVKAVGISGDGLYAVTGSRDRTAKLWELKSGAEIRTFSGHEHTVNGVEFSPDGKYLATSSADNSAKVWDITTGKEIFSTPVERKYMTDVAFTPDGKYLFVTGYSDSASLYDFKSGKLIRKFGVDADQGSGYGSSVAFSADGKWMVIGEDNKTAKVYRCADWQLVYTIKPEQGWCGGCGTLVDFSIDSKSFFKLSHNDKIRQYDLLTGKQIAEFGEEVDKLQGLSLSADGKKLAAGEDNYLLQWDISSKKRLSKIRIDSLSGEANELVYTTDATKILIATSHNTTLVYDAEKGTLLSPLSGILNEQDKGGLDYDADNYWQSYIAKYIRLKNIVALTNNDKQFITGKTGTKATLWNIESGMPERILSGHSKAVICFDLSADNKYLLTGDGSGEAIIWELSTGKKIKSFKGHREPLFDVKFNPGGETIATSSWDASVIIWNIESGKQETELDMGKNSAFSMSFTPDGLYVVTGRFDKSLELREPDSKKIVRTFIGHNDVVSAISFGPDKYKMLTGSWDGTARLWDISTGMMLQKFKGHKGAVHAAVFTADGKKIITAGDDRVIRVWDVNSAKVLSTLEGHQSEISSVKISKDGRMLLSYSLDGTIKCWNLDKGLEFYEHVHFGENEWMARTKDGYFNATAGARNAIHFVKGLQIYKPEQFFEEFYRPELLPQLFKSRGLPGSAQDMDQKLMKSPPPLVKLYALIKDDGTAAELNVKIIDEGGGVDELRISHNGKIVELQKENLTFPSGKGNTTVYKQIISLVGGNNTFSASAFSKGRLESIPVEADVYSKNILKSTVCHVMAIGIDKYKNQQLTLTYARDDAEAVVDIFKNKGQLFSKVVLHTLYDEQATKKSILDTLHVLAQNMASHDVFVFYYAGHGSMADDKFYFIPTDCARLFDTGELSQKAIEATEIQEKFKQIKALKQIIIMDACQSGGSVELLSMRGAMEEKAIAQLSRSAGIHVLASAGNEQSAKEINELKHGLFTYVLLEALSGKADGAPHDGKVTVYELKSYLDDQVPELNNRYGGKAQYPFTFSKGQDFPIVKE